MARGRKPESQYIRELKKEFYRLKHNVLRKLRRVLKKYPDLPSTEKRIIEIEAMHVKGTSLDDIKFYIIKLRSIGERKISSVRTAKEAKQFLDYVNQHDPELTGKAFQLYEKYVVDGTFQDKYKYSVVSDIIYWLDKGYDLENDPEYWVNLKNSIYELEDEEYNKQNEILENELTTLIKY